MKKFILLLTLLIIAMLTLPAQEKVALVIGNSAYEHVASLKNPLNDAQDIGATLENLGFSVTRALDASRGEIQQAVDRFQEASSRRGTKVALFYYSGHGVEYEGSNYIIPVNAEIRNEYELVDQAFSADRIVKAMDRNRAAFNLVITGCLPGQSVFFKPKRQPGPGFNERGRAEHDCLCHQSGPGGRRWIGAQTVRLPKPSLSTPPRRVWKSPP